MQKLTEGPDVADIKSEGRRSSVGKCSVRGGKSRGYCAPKAKATTRRHLKRADKAKIDKEWRE